MAKYYTPEQLKAHAQKAGVKVSTRQIEEWHKAGYLPQPIRQKLPGQGPGRAPYQYPEPAERVVSWLGQYKRHINGEAATKFWLLVEGFDYIDFNINASLARGIAEFWQDLQQRISSLPDIADASRMSEMMRVRVLDEIDENITAPLLANGTITEETVGQMTIGAAFLGILSLSEVPDRPLYLDDVPDYIELLLTEEERTQPGLKEAARAAMPAAIQVANLLEIYARACAGTFTIAGLRATYRIRGRGKSSPPASPQDWDYEPMALVVSSLIMERVIFPQIVPLGIGMLRVLAETDMEDEEITPDEAAVLAKLRKRLQATREILADPETIDNEITRAMKAALSME